MTALTGVLAPQFPRQRLVGLLAALAITSAAFAVGFVVTDRPLVAMLGAVGVAALIVSLARANAATYVVIAVLYSNAAAVAVREYGLPELVGLSFPLLLALPLADYLMLRRQRVVITSALPLLFGYLVVQVLGAVAPRDASSAVDALIVFLIGGFGLYFVITNVLRNFTTLRYAVWTVLFAGALLGALSTFQALTQTYGNDYWGFSTVDLPGREEHLLASLDGTPSHEGSIGEKNRYGQVMLVLVPLGAMVALGERRRPLRLFALLLTSLILLGMVTSFSRGAALGLVTVLAVALLLRYIRPMHVVLILAAIAVMLVAFPRYADRLVDLQAVVRLDRTGGGGPVEGDLNNLRGRATTTFTGLFIWADHPIVGIGRGQFGSYYEVYAGEVADSGFDAHIDHGVSRDPHNLYAGTLAEMGSLGFACFIGIFLITLRDLHRAARRWAQSRPQVAHVAMGLFLAVIAYMASGVALHLSYERYLWFLLALAGAAAHIALKGDESRDFAIDSGNGHRREKTLVGSTA